MAATRDARQSQPQQAECFSPAIQRFQMVRGSTGGKRRFARSGPPLLNNPDQTEGRCNFIP